MIIYLLQKDDIVDNKEIIRNEINKRRLYKKSK